MTTSSTPTQLGRPDGSPVTHLIGAVLLLWRVVYTLGLVLAFAVAIGAAAGFGLAVVIDLLAQRL